jgi:hypothetical protein
MLPNVRLVIAAMFATVVALICGFGMFAAFRVSHEPLVRLPTATASLQLAAANTAKLSLAFAPGEPTGRRVAIAAPPSVTLPSGPPAPGPELGNDADTGPGAVTAAPEPGPAEVEEAASAAGEPKEQAAAPAAPAAPVAELPSAETIGLAASNPMPAVPASEPEPAPRSAETAPAPELRSAAQVAETLPALADPVPAAGEAAPETKPSIAAEPPAEPASVSEVAAFAPLKSPPLPPERPKLDPQAEAPSDAAPGANKKAKQTRAAAKLRFVGRDYGAQYSYSRSFDQTSGYAQAYYQTVPQVTQPVPRRFVRVHHAKTKASVAATGGPYVRATSR